MNLVRNGMLNLERRVCEAHSHATIVSFYFKSKWRGFLGSSNFSVKAENLEHNCRDEVTEEHWEHHDAEDATDENTGDSHDLV